MLQAGKKILQEEVLCAIFEGLKFAMFVGLDMQFSVS
jgi:hypothetical protein